MPIPASSPHTEFARTRLAQIARLVVLRRAGDPTSAQQALLLRAFETMVGDCIELGVGGPALIAASDGACWMGDPAERANPED